MGIRLNVEQAIRQIDRPIFTTREIASIREESISGTSQALSRMQRQGLALRVSRGVWCLPHDPGFTRFGLVPFLSGGSRAYVSLLSALSLHGVIDQVPETVYAVTIGQTRIVKTRLGNFSFHRIQPSLFDGFDWNSSRRSFLLATPEKALVDAFYLSSRKGKRFRFFPEMDASADFDKQAIAGWLDRIDEPAIQTSVRKKMASIGLAL